jgi:tetratricopeptide (TPR) repeat protein
MRAKAGMASISGNDTTAKRLKSWKEIASFFGTDERTVRRWEERGLPVHRVPGGARPTIYAEPAELEAWFRGRGRAGPDEAASPGAVPPARHPWIVAAVGLALLAATAAGILFYAGTGQPEAPVARHQPPEKAVDLFTAGVSQAERATPESLRGAIALYGQAIAEDPAYAEAYAALANTYIRLRTFAAVSEAEAYPRARAAAQRALDLDPNLPQAHAAIGFVNFYFDWDFAGGLHHFSEARRLDPRSSSGHYQYGMALLHAGDFPAALREIEMVQRLDPRARGILADKGFILYLLGRRDEGMRLINQVATDDPDFLMPHHYLSLIHLSDGDWLAGLGQAEIVARLRQDRDRQALAATARRSLEQEGPQAMLRSVLAGQQRLHAAGREPLYVLAETAALLGDHHLALRYLERSIAAREPLALTMRIDPLLRSLRGEPEYLRLAARFGRQS